MGNEFDVLSWEPAGLRMQILHVMKQDLAVLFVRVKIKRSATKHIWFKRQSIGEFLYSQNKLQPKSKHNGNKP